MKQKVMFRALSAIVNEYSKTHGEALGDLTTWTFDASIFESNESLLAIVKTISPEDLLRKKYIAKLLSHLTSEEYLDYRSNRFYLTRKGFLRGSESAWNRALRFLNENPGLISALAVVISVAALYFSYTKP